MPTVCSDRLLHFIVQLAIIASPFVYINNPNCIAQALRIYIPTRNATRHDICLALQLGNYKGQVVEDHVPSTAG